MELGPIMTRMFLMNCLFYAIVQSININKRSIYDPLISRSISKISSDHREWIRENCGIKSDTSEDKRESGFKLYGGQETENFEFPCAVGLEINRNVYDFSTNDLVGYESVLCSGSLISNKHILTSQLELTQVLGYLYTWYLDYLGFFDTWDWVWYLGFLTQVPK